MLLFGSAEIGLLVFLLRLNVTSSTCDDCVETHLAPEILEIVYFSLVILPLQAVGPERLTECIDSEKWGNLGQEMQDPGRPNLLRIGF